uniref:hypothetical protein n=1 Tax=Pulvinaster venetus TaxID=427767 RepID=UPI001FCDF267|nr:hypothetical protein MW436_pgp131 [Pulvinaster venetus]UNJ16928.1 hypothetical protein [Pulvinaster venetus]
MVFLLIGFFGATVLATLPGQTGDWGVVAGLIAIFEIISKISYNFANEQLKVKVILNIFIVNNIKIGIIYGLFVDAFKLGS